MSRVDLYRNVHKGQRARLFSLAVELGRVDGEDATVLADLTERLRTTLDELRRHGEHEESYIHPLLQERAPEIAAELEREHRSVEADMAEFEDMLGATTSDGGLSLYRAWCRIVASYLQHLDKEEQFAMPSLWRTCSDEEILAVIGAFSSSLSASERLNDLLSQAPTLAPQELALYVKALGRSQEFSEEKVFDRLAGVLTAHTLDRLRKDLTRY
ncbi:MAG TPA: hemerythrin domain-containing protein [Vitreimonas sp.]|uniref:hemerythrin domain-containing protein n=1 Tax=Vitreimonas sp. TaxID=3069702 RepID=UPI002D5BDAB0|nr:hemerythrin domain-containing protein [Vitreimonas sp.]HYD86914.1 hemerythrin domain-containing protein [Vitreimonas sp.]